LSKGSVKFYQFDVDLEIRKVGEAGLESTLAALDSRLSRKKPEEYAGDRESQYCRGKRQWDCQLVREI
jgi:hypothetical protein